MKQKHTIRKVAATTTFVISAFISGPVIVSYYGIFLMFTSGSYLAFTALNY